MAGLADDLFSPEWYRVAAMRPLLRRHVQVTRQQFRGEQWIVLREPGSNRLFRLTQPAWEFVSRLDGAHTLDETWLALCTSLGDDVPTQREVIRLVSQLNGADLLQAELPPDLEELGERARNVAHQKLMGYIKSPLALRFPLVDPDRFLSATMPVGNLLFSRGGLYAWAALVASALFLVALHWTTLTGNMIDQVLATENLVLLGILYPLVKLVHEFGHGWAVKRWGGEVRELGVMFLIFVPVPYVDASAAGFFEDKRKRMIVGFAGMQVELLIAALATFVWVAAEPGLVRAVAYNLMVIAGVSAVLFNGNPLLRFDAYHILADWLEMPNFGNRANQYIGYLVQKRILKMEADDPTMSVREARWLGFYAILSFLYRLTVTFGIVFMVAGRFFFIGILLAIYSLANALVMPAWRMLKILATDNRFQAARTRGWAVLAGSLAALALFSVLVPLPSYTVTEGVVWVPESSRLYAAADGEVAEVLRPSGVVVHTGEPLLRMQSAALETNVISLTARVQELDLRYRESAAEAREQLAIIREEYERSLAELADAQSRYEGLTVASPRGGRLALDEREGLIGRYLTRGSVLGYIVDEGEVSLRVVVPQDDIDLVRHHTRAVEVRFASAPATVIPATLRREVPEAQRHLPSAALSLDGGGEHALDPAKAQELGSVEPLFQFELTVPPQAAWRVGERVFVRFVHTPDSLWNRVRREVRRVFLRRLDV